MDTFDRILEILSRNKMTQADLSRATGISTGLISQWKKRCQNPSAEKLQRIADYFGVSVDYLLTGEESKEKPSAEAEGDIDAMVESILSELTEGHGDTLMLDGKPASAKALEYLRESIRANIEHAKRLNEQENG